MKAAAAILVALAAGASAQSVPAFRYGTPSAKLPRRQGHQQERPPPTPPPRSSTPPSTRPPIRASPPSTPSTTGAPSAPGACTIIGNVEGETVAYCTKAP